MNYSKKIILFLLLISLVFLKKDSIMMFCLLSHISKKKIKTSLGNYIVAPWFLNVTSQ